MSELEIVKIEIREKQIPYFDDDTIMYYIDKNKGNLKEAIYELLILKSEDSTISISGLSTQDTSAYFKRLASKFKTYNSGILGG